MPPPLWGCLAGVALAVVANIGVAIYAWRTQAPKIPFWNYRRSTVYSKREPR